MQTLDQQLPAEVRDLLPDEIVELMGLESVDREEEFEAFCSIIAAKRDEARDARVSSGIEQAWIDAEEAYLGVDDMNRAEFAGAKWAKPTNMSGGLVPERNPKTDGPRSTVFVPLTSRYVDAGAAKLAEILLPIDDKAFSFEPTPIPDLVAGKEDMAPVMSPDGSPVMHPEGRPMLVKDVIEKKLEEAAASAKKAERRIFDWMVESNYRGEMRKVIHDGARIGVGVLKGPFPVKRISKAVRQATGGVALEIKSEIKPGYTWVDPWNIFPDPACGENIADGDYILERDFISARTLKGLKGQDGYLSEQIDKVLKEGPGKCNVDGSKNPNHKENKHKFEIWYFYGAVSRRDMELAKAKGVVDLPEDVEDVFAIVTLINDTVIRATINPLDSGEFPYHAVPWRRRSGNWAGVGVGEQLRVPQRMVNAATRAMLNNAGKSAGSQVVIDQGSITPADGSYTITPDKLWYKAADSVMDDVRKAFALFEIPNVTPAMQAIIEYALRMAEESTSIPLITQGQTGPTTPETLGATQLQNNNANQLLRAVGYQVDDYITDPVVHQSYEYLLLDPEVPDDEKGDFQINAHGSATLVERAIQDQTIQQMGQLVMNPTFGIDPEKWFSEMLKTKRLDPRNFQYDEAERERRKNQPPAPPPQVAVAQIRSQTELQKVQIHEQGETQRTQMEIQGDLQEAGMERDRDTLYVQAQTQKNAYDHDASMKELLVKRELALLQYANQRQITLDEVKADLAKETMRLSTQKELAAASNALDLHKHATPQIAVPAIEPPGRAPAGEAFQR